MRDELGINGIDRRARDMQQLKSDLASFVGGSPIANKVYDRSTPDSPKVQTVGSLQPKPVVLLDGFSWCYEDFDGMWDLKYAFLPHSFEASEEMSMERDLAERSYNVSRSRIQTRCLLTEPIRKTSTMSVKAPSRIYLCVSAS